MIPPRKDCTKIVTQLRTELRRLGDVLDTCVGIGGRMSTQNVRRRVQSVYARLNKIVDKIEEHASE